MRLGSRGIALVSVLFCLLTSLVLTATLFFSWFLSAQATANTAAGDDALHAAESGVEHLWAILEPAPDFARELGWPAGVPPFGSIVGFPEAPRTYRVIVTEAPDEALSVVSHGTSRRGTRRAVEAIFRRDAFRPPATLILAPGTTLSDASGSLDVTGAGADPEIPALGGEERAEAIRLRSAGYAAVIVGGSGLSQALDPLRGAVDQTFAVPQNGGSWGSDATPLVTRLVGDAELSGTIVATGIVIADAPLRVRGYFEIHGLLLAPAGIDVSGELAVHGAGWLATDFRIAAGGALSLTDSRPGLDAAATAGRDVLPRPAVLSAWREVW